MTNVNSPNGIQITQTIKGNKTSEREKMLIDLVLTLAQYMRKTGNSIQSVQRDEWLTSLAGPLNKELRFETEQ